MHYIYTPYRLPGSALSIMKEITEELIERYVGFPESLDHDVRERVKAALKVDRAARETAEFYREYYRQLRGGGSAGDPPNEPSDDDRPSKPSSKGSSRAPSSRRDAPA